MTNEDLIQGLKEQRSKSHARMHRLLERVVRAEAQDVSDLLDKVGDERRTGEQIEQELQNLGGA